MLDAAGAKFLASARYTATGIFPGFLMSAFLMASISGSSPGVSDAYYFNRDPVVIHLKDVVEAVRWKWKPLPCTEDILSIEFYYIIDTL